MGVLVMAAHGPNGEYKQGISDPREIRYLIKRLNITTFLDPYIKENIKLLNLEIETHLKNQYQSADMWHKLVLFRCEYLTDLLSINLFDWMDNDIACFYAWGRIRKFHNLETLDKLSLMIDTISIDLAKENPVFINYYEQLNLNKHPSSTKERKHLIIEFFDSQTPLSNIEQKTNLLEKIKLEFAFLYNNKKPFHWLSEKDENRCEWTWNYIKEHSDFCQYLSPINNNERYLSIYISYYLWSAKEDTKKLFLIRINKAYSQQKFRESIKGKKALNIFIDEESKKKLDKISKKMNEKINKTIELLIENEYSKIK